MSEPDREVRGLREALARIIISKDDAQAVEDIAAEALGFDDE